MLRVRESLDRGELVGILSDRTLGGEKYMMVPFLGKDAAFPTGPLILAAALHAPVLLFYGVRTGVRRYEVGFRYFANEIVLRRECRNVDLRRWLEQYAAWLEEMCRLHPFNWFNFYDFWEKPRDATPIKNLALTFIGIILVSVSSIAQTRGSLPAMTEQQLAGLMERLSKISERHATFRRRRISPPWSVP